MAHGEHPGENDDELGAPAPSPSVADLRITELEQRLRAEPLPSVEEASQIKARLASLYLIDLGDPLGAAVHIEELLGEEQVHPDALDLATRLLDVKTVAPRIAKKLGAAYGRLGRTAEEAAVLNRELKLAKAARLEEVKRRLADSRYLALGDPEGALELLEPLVLKSAGDDALRGRYVEIATASGHVPRAIKVLSRAMPPQKDPERRARVAYAVGSLWRAQGDPKRAQASFVDALATGSDGEAVVAAARQLVELGTENAEVRAIVLRTMARLGHHLDTPELARLALAEVDALIGAGQREDALELCRRALDGSPGAPDLLVRFQDLADGPALQDERRLRFARAVPLIDAADGRQALMHRWAEFEARECGNLPAALEIWRRILSEHPGDQRAEEALVDAYEETGDREALLAEIENALEAFDGPARHGLLLRKARALGRQGERERALSVLTELLAIPDLPGPIIEALAEIAYDEDDPDLYQRALERQASLDDPALRARALERLGDFHFERLGDTRAAVQSWKPAARLAAGGTEEEGQHAEELYERVLQASPDDCEAAEHLLRLYVQSERWVGIPEVYAVLLRAGREPERVVGLLLDLEAGATRAGAVDDFVSMVDEAIPVAGAEPGPLLHRLMRAKARALSSDPARQTAASRAHRDLIESSGTEDDLRVFRRFIDARTSADERLDDLRWWFAFQSERAEDPIPVLVEWAGAEEDYGDVNAAIGVHERIVQADPARTDSLRALARLAAGSGDFEKSLAALQGLRERISPEAAGDIDLHMASILVGDLARPVEAAAMAVPLLEREPLAESARRIVRAALDDPGARAEVVALLEAAASSSESRAALELLVESDSETPRASWFLRLSELHRATDRGLEILLRGVSALPSESDLWDGVRRFAESRKDPDVLVRAFRRCLEVARIDPDRVEAIGRRVVELQDECSSDTARVVETLEAVLDRAPAARWALDRVKLVLSSAGRWDDLFERFDHAILAARTNAERADLLDEAVIAAKDLAGQAGRAIHYLEALRALRPGDAALSATLERLCEREGEVPKLIELLAERARAAAPAARRELEQRIAGLWLDLGDVVRAQAALRALVEREDGLAGFEELLERLVRTETTDDGKDDGEARSWAIELLKKHYAGSDRILDRVRIAEAELRLLRDPSRRVPAVEELVRLRIQGEGSTSGAFLRVLPLAVQDAGEDPDLERTACATILEVAAERLLQDAPDDAAPAAWWTLHVLAARSLARGEHGTAAKLLVDHARLPFGRERRRGLLGQAARIFADHAGDPDRAIAILRELFEEDAGDEVADASSARFARLLVDAGLDVEQALLSERLARARAASGNASDAAEHWAHAAALWEAQRNAPRAISAHSEAAALGSRASVEAVARLHAAEGDLRAAAHALEWALGTGDDEPIALALSDLYVRLGERASARARLEVAVPGAPARSPIRERLAALYRDEELWEPLSGLLAAGAEHIEDIDARFRALEEAIHIELEKLGNAEGAIPLLRAALALRPGTPELEAALAEALENTYRFEEAAALLRSQIDAFSERRPKQRAVVHHRLARVLLRSGDRPGSLRELETAVDIDPTDPRILRDLGRLALEDGELDVADRTFRSLLLAVHHTSRSGDAPGKVEVYLALGDVAERQGHAARAQDLVESAFEAALDGPEEAGRLEELLEARGRNDLLVRAIERRAGTAATPSAKVAALGDLLCVHRSTGAGGADLGKTIAQRIDEASSDAARARASEPELWAALADMAHAAGGDAARLSVITRLEEVIPRIKKKGERKRLRLELARVLLETPDQGEPTIRVLENLVEEDPADLEALDLLANVLERERKDEKLVERLEARLAALGTAPEPAAFVALASRLSAALERVGRSERALPLHESIARIDGLDVDILRQTLDRLEALGSSELADALERLAQRYTGAAAADVARRLLALRTSQGDEPAVFRALELGFAADPADARFRDPLVQSLARQGREPELGAVLARALEASPDDPALLSARAAAHEARGSDDLAVLDLERAAASDPAAVPALVELLGRVVSRGASPKLDDHALRLVDLSLPGDRSTALREIDRLLERRPEHAPALERKAALLLGSGDVHGAMATYRALLPLIRADGAALARTAAAFAEACEKAGRSTDARDALEEARRFAPHGREIRMRLEAVYEAAGEPSRLADLVLEDAAEAPAGPARAALYRRAAELLLRSGRDAARALSALEEARRADPENPEALLLLAEAWSQGGRHDDALRLLVEWTETKKSKSGPVASRVYLEIAKMRLRTDDLFEAFDALERSFNHDPKNVDSSLLLGLVAIDLDDERTATRALRAVTASRTDKVAPESKAVAFYHLAEFADRRGDKRSARLMAHHAVTENPGHGAARALLEALGG